ncbi:MAG: hypothetical protein WD577_13865 [Bacteroidales bacterium]
MNKYLIRNRMMIIPALLFVVSLTAAAQPGGHMQRFKEEKISFYNEKLDLSEAEAEKFWPVQEDLHNRNMKINEDEKNLLVYYSSNYEAMSDQEIDETVQKFLELQQSRVDLSREYHKTFVEIMGKKKTMQMYALDREFRMYILKKFRAGEGGGRGRGYRNNK